MHPCIPFCIAMFFVDETPPTPEPTLPVAAIDIRDANGNEIINEVPVGQLITISGKNAVHANKKGSLTWRVKPQLQSYVTPDGDTLIVNTGLKPQVVDILQIVSLGDLNAYTEISIRIGNAPQPPPDDDTVPIPQPEPTPTVGKLRVVIIEEVSQRPSLPSSQQAVLLDKSIRDYMKTHCELNPKDNTPEFRLVDKDLTPDEEWLKKAFSEQRSSLPWIVLSNGKTGFSGPLPLTAEETLNLLKKYGGE